MLQVLKFIGIVFAMFSIVLLCGFSVTGSWRDAWRYFKDWGRVIWCMVLVSAVLMLAAQ
jgi:hypothetical protein